MKLIQFYLLTILLFNVSACSSVSENGGKATEKNKEKFSQNERFYGRHNR